MCRSGPYHQLKNVFSQKIYRYSKSEKNFWSNDVYNTSLNQISNLPEVINESMRFVSSRRFDWYAYQCISKYQIIKYQLFGRSDHGRWPPWPWMVPGPRKWVYNVQIWLSNVNVPLAWLRCVFEILCDRAYLRTPNLYTYLTCIRRRTQC